MLFLGAVMGQVEDFCNALGSSRGIPGLGGCTKLS